MRANITKGGTPLIYFIADYQAQAIKIGYSTNVPARLATLQTASSSPLVLLATMSGGLLRERRLHQMFERIHGEWFSPTTELLRFIAASTQTTEAFDRCMWTECIPAPTVASLEAAVAPVILPPASAPRGRRRAMRPLPWASILHDLAYAELTLTLVFAAFASLHFVIVPALASRLTFPLNLWLVIDAVFVWACLWALTHRHARR